MAFPDGWQRKCAIVIQAAQVAETLTDFPMLVTGDNLPAEIWANADDGGGDLRFSADDAGAVRLACEIVSFSTSGESAEIYVKVPSVSSAVNTTIYIWYNNTGQTQPAATDTYGSQAVWESDYAAVYHFNQNPAGGTLLDSTANGNNGTVNGSMDASDLVTGQIGAASAWDFNGLNNYVAINNFSALSNKFTIIAIVNFPENQLTGNYDYIYSLGQTLSAGNIASMAKWQGGDSNANKLYSYNGSQFGYGNLIVATNWHILSVSAINNALRLGIDAVFNNVAFGQNYNLTMDIATIAAASWASVNHAKVKISEMRIAFNNLSDDNLTATKNNTFSPATFAIAGTPTAVSAFNPAWAKHSNQIIRAI